MSLTVYANCWHVPAAGQYYRMQVPLRAMEKLGLASPFLDDSFQDINKRSQFLWGSNVQLHFLIAGKGIHSQFQHVHDMKPAVNKFGEMQYPPVIVYDMDDDIEMVSPLNPKFSVLGTRDDQGNLLMPRSELGIRFSNEHAGEDEPLFLWRHGMETPHGTFRAEHNIINHAQVRKAAATAHAVTCTSKRLQEQVAKRWNPRTFVYPNSILFDDFHEFDIRRDPTDVRVLWQGGYSHFPDFYPLRHAFHEASVRMPQIKWVVFGTLFRWIYDNIPSPRVEFHKWVDFKLFHMKLGTLVPDINIAPLADTPFNRCKSGIKFYEAAALKVPTLAQKAGPYEDEIADGENGLLFSTPQEFVEKLELLVKDVEYRKALGCRAYDWVYEHRNAEKNVPALANFYAELIKEVHGYDVAA